MNEAPITRSPHAFVPKRQYTEKEEAELYRTRLDETFKPYTVIDVLTKVYHRSFTDDLRSELGKNPTSSGGDGDWRTGRIWVNECRVIRLESLYNQPLGDYCVEIKVDARVKIEEVRVGNDCLRRSRSLRQNYWLRYFFDFRPCELTCRYDGAREDKEVTLLELNPGKIRVDKYLLPVLNPEDNETVTHNMLRKYYPEAIEQDIPIDAELFVKRMRRYLVAVRFPDSNTLGEYFFSHGKATLVDDETGKIVEKSIRPGTILYNKEECKTTGSKNTTILHESVHAELDTAHFFMQRTHGHNYCSYVCKKYRKSERTDDSQDGHLSPIDIMEIQANTIPGYLMIRQNTGKRHAAELLKSYGGERTLSNMSRLVDDMAEYYGTTKHLARTRLLDFGFKEVRGIMRSANGGLVPAYMSALKDNQTYTIDEADAVKEFVRNDEFRETLLTGCYVYTEGHYCLDSRKYVCRDYAGNPHLTIYAREHMAECCLVFEIFYENPVRRIVNGVVQKGVGKGRKEIKYVTPEGNSVLTEEGKKLRAQITTQMADSAKLSDSFNVLTCRYMEERHMRIEALADATGLSVETIKDMRRNPNKVFSIQSVVAVCIALRLPKDVREEYLDKCPSKFMNTVDMKLYQYAMVTWGKLTVPEVNRKLVECGAQPLTNLVEGFDENGVKIG